MPTNANITALTAPMAHRLTRIVGAGMPCGLKSANIKNAPNTKLTAPVSPEDPQSRRQQLEIDKPHAQEDQSHADPVDRQIACPEKRQSEQNRPERSWENKARTQHLDHDQDPAKGQQDEGDLRIGDHVQEALNQIGFDGVDLDATRSQSDLAPVQGHRHAVEPRQQIVLVLGDDIDYLQLQRL